MRLDPKEGQAKGSLMLVHADLRFVYEIQSIMHNPALVACELHSTERGLVSFPCKADSKHISASQ